eukprot:m.334904 g.334904  ORF g.334904 m.334904 type:complete len:118 (-) comp55675_c0_seq2:507-860(-)
MSPKKTSGGPKPRGIAAMAASRALSSVLSRYVRSSVLEAPGRRGTGRATSERVEAVQREGRSKDAARIESAARVDTNSDFSSISQTSDNQPIFSSCLVVAQSSVDSFRSRPAANLRV